MYDHKTMYNWFCNASDLARGRKKYHNELSFIHKSTTFLPKDATLSQRLWHLLYKNKTIPQCKNKTCNTYVRWDRRNKKYNSYCSHTCKNSDPIFHCKRIKTLKLTLEEKKIHNKKHSQQIVISNDLANCEHEMVTVGIIKSGKINPQYKKKLQRYPTLQDKIFKLTSFFPDDVCLRQRVHGIINNIKNAPTCKLPICNNYCIFFTDGKRANTYSIYCSPKCSSLSESRVKNIQQTKLKKYNDRHYSNRDQARISYADTFSIPQSSLKKLESRDWLYDQHYNNKKSLAIIAHELEVSKTAVQRRFQNFNIPVVNYPSSLCEQQLVEFITSLIGTEHVITNCRTLIPPQEVDIYIPSKKLAIEVNGCYWHSDTNRKDRNYHLNKLKRCNKKGIKLLQISDLCYQQKTNIIHSMVAYQLGCIQHVLNGRDTTVCEISSSTSNLFLQENHFQGAYNSSINLGLFFNNELVGCMTFSKPRYSNLVEYELIRFACKTNTIIRGGASKLFKFFLKKYNPQSIISYSNKERSIGNIYKVLGFKYSHASKPGYCYYKKDRLFSRVECQKHKLDRFLNNFNSELTEYQNMRNNGYHRIWDCGNDVWLWKTNINTID